MIVRCFTCGNDFEAISRTYEECTPCFLARIEGGKTEEEELPDTDVLEGDDPDDYLWTNNPNHESDD